MGNCCTKNQYNDMQDNLISIRTEDWFVGNEYFDWAGYHRNIEFENYTFFQKALYQGWKDVDLNQNFIEETSSPQFNNSAYLQLCLDIRKGVPNYLIRNVISKLITYDNDVAKTEYYDYTNQLDPDLNFLDLPAEDDPLFGRKDLLNCFLTYRGATACKSILYVIHKKTSDIEVCLILPRVTQILLWFMKEHETYQILQVLIAESRNKEKCQNYSFHFPLTDFQHKKVVKKIFKRVKEKMGEIQINEKCVKKVIKDIAFNMLVGYISPSFYPLILMNFLADGIGSIMKFTAAVVYLALKQCEELRGDSKTIPDWRSYTRSEVIIFKILKKAFKINIEKSNKTDTASVTADR
ncbi:unnamed protein product [Blepharisma stoltei]|uniref:Uncharacterized protein n=1 Tax=Blepharisma stoltei TaxID=1481888 RepID=A0AAU9ITZ2_9CILI|nr:unnamed protein product [Blepharisma stoltei]